MKVLLADANPDRARAMEGDLVAFGVTSVLNPGPQETLADAVARLLPDVVIVDMARPDRDSLDGIRRVTADNPRPIVMFVDQDDPAFMEDAISAGVSSYNVVGTALPEIKPIVKAAVALFRRHEQTKDELRRAEAVLRERNTIDQAKSLLMRQRKMTEPEAYRWLRRRAMNTAKRIADIAADLITAEAPERRP